MMSSHALSTFIDVESSGPSRITPPSAVVLKDGKPILPSSPNVHELDEIRFGRPLNGSADSAATQNSATPNELERSAPPTPKRDEAVNLVQSFSNPPMNKWRLLSACLMNFANGLNDGAAGAIIPYMEKDYHIGYAVVSLIFLGNALGFIFAAPVTHAIEGRLGRARTYMAAELLYVVAYIIIVCRPPFPLVPIGFLLVGFGLSVNLALSNVFAANLTNSTAALGALHGSYGIGGTIAPLIATAMISHGMRWSFFYAIPLVLAFANLAFAGWSFWSFEKDLPNQLLTALQRTASQRATDEREASKSQLLRRALKNKTTLLGALFIFAYQGAEVSISGWIISFLITYRHGDPSKVGYVTAGFWGGITAGRFLLSQPAHKIGEKRSAFGLVAGAAAFQLLIWLVPNVIGDAVAVSIVGLLLGPVYPCAMAVFSKLLPRNLQMSSLSFVSAMGSSGGAAAPFFTGILSQKAGTFVLHPICIGLFVVMEVAWACLPRIGKRTE